MQKEYVNLGDVCRNRLGIQCQYGSRYASRRWSHSYTFCGEGLRIIDTGEYHSMLIHEDDVDTFVTRVLEVRS